jgi:FtsH-binding integral membrane protein
MGSRHGTNLFGINSVSNLINMKNTIIFWILAMVITLLAVVYQKMTGPTYEKREKVFIEGQRYKLKLPRSMSIGENNEVVLNIPAENISGKLNFRRYPTNDDWKTVDFTRETRKDKSVLVAQVPAQPAAGKIEYYFELSGPTEHVIVNLNNPVVIRFKGHVPGIILWPHVILIFFAMLLSNFTGLLAITKNEKYRSYTVITVVFLAAGGMILGPVVQKYAFGELWTGIPKGWDLTDNKTLVAFAVWVIALIFSRKKDRYYLVWIAALITLIIYCVPHSMFGSQLDPSTGKVIQA